MLFLLLGVLSVSGHVHSHDGHDCIHEHVQSKAQHVTAQQSYLDHPFETHVHNHSHHFSTLAQGATLSYPGSGFQPIRIYFDLSHLSSDTGKWCKTSGATYVDNDGVTRSCTNDDKATNEKLSFLTNTILPAAQDFFTRALRVVPVSGSLKIGTGWDNNMECMDATIKSAHTSTGVGSFDYILYVTARPTQGNTLAWAGACQWDQHDRPIAGQANFGPNRIEPTTDAGAVAIQVSTFIHEVAHALGFSSNSFSKFRDAQGNRHSTVTTQSSERGQTVTKIVTPNVVAKAREHFNCPSLSGVEIENGGGSGTVGSHLEKRIYHNDFMTGTSSNDPVYSPISLAVFADSGWYQVDYAAAGDLRWGKDLGCTFASDYCGNWPQAAKDQGSFCSAAGAKACAGSVSQYKGYCNLATYSSTLQSSYQYFSDGTKGGQDQLADFCPYVAPYSNGDCRLAANAPANNYYGEAYAAEARCFSHTLLKSGYQYDGSSDTGCYTTRCASVGGQTTLYVTVNGAEKACPRAGGTLSSFTGMQGSIECPPAADLCVHTTSDAAACPNDCNGQGTCSAGTCICNSGFSGTSCSTTPTPAPVSPTPAPATPTPAPAAGATKLARGSTVSASVGVRAYAYFETDAIAAGEQVSVVVTPEAGMDPDVYASFTVVAPSSSSNSFKAASGGNGAVETLTAEGPATGGVLHIAVYGYTASSFSIKLTVSTSTTCDAATTCSGNGTCAAGVCSCSAGYSGLDCATLDCPGSPDCSGHGTCSGQATCSCAAGYSGDACQIYTATSNSEEIGTNGGERTIEQLAANSWKYFVFTIGSPPPAKLQIQFTKPECSDSSTFRDGKYNDLCSGWVGYDCSGNGLSTTQSSDLKEACPVACGQCPGKGTMLLARFGQKPVMSGTGYTADFFDQTSWQQNSGTHSLSLTNIQGTGQLWIGVLNHASYANGQVNGVLSVLPQASVAALVASCSRDQQCSSHGDCDVQGFCVCDDLFHGEDCGISLAELPASGELQGQSYDFYYYEVTQENSFSVSLNVSSTGTRGSGSSGSRPRLFLRQAPHLPTADAMSFTDFDAVESDGNLHSVFVDTSALGAGVWYIGVLNAAPAGGQAMQYRLTVTAGATEPATTHHCSAWQSETCEDDPTYTCPTADGVISEIVHFDYWFNQSRIPSLAGLVQPSTCPATGHDRWRGYEYCHEYMCPEVYSCLGQNSCTIQKCTAPSYYLDLCYEEGQQCGFKLSFVCSVGTGPACPAQGGVCGLKGTCLDVQGRPVCECADGWTGSDCKTPPPFYARLGGVEAQVLASVAAAFPVTSVDTSESPAVDYQPPPLSGAASLKPSLVAFATLAAVLAQ